MNMFQRQAIKELIGTLDRLFSVLNPESTVSAEQRSETIADFIGGYQASRTIALYLLTSQSKSLNEARKQRMLLGLIIETPRGRFDSPFCFCDFRVGRQVLELAASNVVRVLGWNIHSEVQYKFKQETERSFVVVPIESCKEEYEVRISLVEVDRKEKEIPCDVWKNVTKSRVRRELMNFVYNCVAPNLKLAPLREHHKPSNTNRPL